MAGGVAKIPLVAQRLSAQAKTSVVTAIQPGLAMAVGAVMLSARQPVEQQEDELESTTMAAMVGASTGSFAGSTGGFTASTDTLGASTGGALFDDPSETLHQLAWSEADDSSNEPVLYSGEPYDDDARVTPSQLLQLPKFEPPEEPPRGNRLPQLFLGLAALVSMVAIGGVAFTLTSSTSHPPAPAPAPLSTSAVPPPALPSSNPPSPSPLPPPPPSPAPSATVAPPVTSEAPPPPPPPPVTTTYQPPPSTTQQATSTTPTTTTTTPTTTTSTPPPPSTTTSTTPSEVMTTTYLKLPFVPVPIPVQVPEGQAPQASRRVPTSRRAPTSRKARTSRSIRTEARVTATKAWRSCAWVQSAILCAPAE